MGYDIDSEIMFDGTGPSGVTNNAEKASVEYSRKNREGIRGKLQRLRQSTERKKLSASRSTPSSSLRKEDDPEGPIEEETRDAQSTVASEHGKVCQVDTIDPQHQSCSEENSREGQTEEHSQPSPSTKSTNIGSKEKDECSTNTTCFHVRISIGYLTGLKIDKIAKRAKQPTNNQITVGFVELAGSGKYTALSQPILTNVGEKAKTTKVFWANQRGDEEISKSKSRRRLHFSLELEREGGPCDSREDNDGNSVTSQASFVPEVVKLLFGLKCGDERIPLGIAKFVVNGRETVEQKMELKVLPTRATIGPKTKRGIFGRKRSSFTNGDLAFKLSRSAKLRVKADVKIGYPGQDGADIWGHDESSYNTKWTFDAGAELSPFNRTSSTERFDFSRTMAPPGVGGDMRERSNSPFHKKSHDKIDNSMHTSLCIFKNNGQRKVHDVPMKYISVEPSNELMSVVSSVSRSNCANHWSCTPLFCGGDDLMATQPQYRGPFATSFSFESSQMTENELLNFYGESQTFDSSAECSLEADDSATMHSQNETQTNTNVLKESDGDVYDDLLES
mmetsp:Transcript_23089/g.46981  ORF Transcript_23089/g.46981 Transcript_23089/m.46981 type:complete len:562 (+) Transcript_23089:67-1752(+)